MIMLFWGLYVSNFFSAVYSIVAHIPRGKVSTYGQIAARLGNPRAARVVGEAVRRVPEYLDLPCHRVVNRAGAMAPEYVFGGSEKQRELLEREGVIFKDDGCIDMKKCLWRD
jgi:methylated-DNA-protein-cysteine methyltransferase-like protein